MSLCRDGLAGLCLLVLLLGPAPARAQAGTLVPFVIEDQHDRVHRNTDFIGSIVILIGSDGKGSGSTGPWALAIREALETDPGFDAVRFLDVADLRGVPFFLKGRVKGRFPPSSEDWVLLDWSGVLAESYEFQAGQANIVIFGADGRLVHQASGRRVEPGILAELVASVRTLLSRDGGVGTAVSTSN